MPAGKDAGARDNPRLLPEESSQNNSSPLQNILWKTQSEEGQNHFIGDIDCVGPGVTEVQRVKLSQHLQRWSQKDLLNPQRKEVAGFCSPLFAEHHLQGTVHDPEERAIVGIDYGLALALCPHG